MPLTDTAVKNAKPKAKPYKLTDGDGLYLLIKPNGGRYWRFKYLYVGREKLLALGTYPGTISYLVFQNASSSAGTNEVRRF